MSETTRLVPVPFHGDTIMAIETLEGRFAALKPICERFGLAWQPQHRKLMARETLWGIHTMVIPSAGGPQEMTCLPVSKLAAWLFSIHASKVKPELRSAVEMYQREAADVLDRHFRLREERRDAAAEMREKMLWRAGRHLLLTNTKWAKAYQMLEMGMSDYLIAQRLNWSMDRWRSEKHEMTAAGLNPKCRDDMKVSPTQGRLFDA